MIADYVTDTGDKAGDKAGMAVSPGDFRLMMEREETVKLCKSRNFVCLDHCWVLNMYFLSGTPVPLGIY